MSALDQEIIYQEIVRLNNALQLSVAIKIHRIRLSLECTDVVLLSDKRREHEQPKHDRLNQTARSHEKVKPSYPVA